MTILSLMATPIEVGFGCATADQQGAAIRAFDWCRPAVIPYLVRTARGATPTDRRHPVSHERQTIPVAHFSEELANRTSELLVEPGILTVRALEELVQRIAGRPDLWRPLVVVDHARRRYELLYDDDRVDIWVLSWMPGQRTGFHDHDCSGVGLICAQGELDEESLAIGAEATRITMTPGDCAQRGGRIHPRRLPSRG